jgi:hypothetical protein
MKLRFKIKLWVDQTGASAVEFAIVIPLLMMMIFGTIEFGLLLFNKQVMVNATREGCRFGVIMRKAPRTVSSEDTDIQNWVIGYAANHLITFGSDVLDATDVTINRQDPVLLAFGTNLTVRTQYMYQFLFLSTLGVGPVDLSYSATMKME